MSALTDRIVEVLTQQHRWITDGDVLISCSCGELSFTGESWEIPRLPQWAAHVAAAVAAELQLTDGWGEGYRAGVIEGMYRAAHNAQDHARATELGIPYEQGLPAADVARSEVQP